MKKYRGFGMLRYKNGWAVIHTPTDRAVCHGAKNYLQAMTIVDAMHLAHDDWSFKVLDMPIAKSKRIGGLINALTKEKSAFYR